MSNQGGIRGTFWFSSRIRREDHRLKFRASPFSTAFPPNLALQTDRVTAVAERGLLAQRWQGWHKVEGSGIIRIRYSHGTHINSRTSRL